ncbi:Uncharacterised protein [Paenibacillus macerans]|uniref:Uncharacterized protein n=1 Tax=Paenibacillus macerans TaxID=44252 RepID=A0A090Y6K5_PAEMA|nr:hypothetical protein DJ90_4832 [Paenibacillus macerans]SUA86397.1 Uncharacterised protein [Paenibacillus macerans]
MTKLVRKNYNQEQSLHGYYIACTCLCAVCTCKVVNALSVGSNSSSNGLNVSNATSTAQHSPSC